MDPKAVHYIINHEDSFQKPPQVRYLLNQVLGESEQRTVNTKPSITYDFKLQGILTVEGRWPAFNISKNISLITTRQGNEHRQQVGSSSVSPFP